MISKPSRRCGITLTEVVLTTPMVALVLVAAMTSVGGVLRTVNATSGSSDAQSLALGLMSEVLQQPYEDPDNTPAFGTETDEANTDREDFDDVDDYHGWSNSPPDDKNGGRLSDYDGWTRSVEVTRVQLSDPTQTAVSDTGLKRIRVSVTDAAGQATELISYRSRWGALESDPLADATVQTYVSHELEVGGRHTFNGAHVSNHAE